MGDRRLPVGGSVLVSGGELAEPVILVRVHAHHWAACSCECPVDGSDILWSHDDDRLRVGGTAARERQQVPADATLKLGGYSLQLLTPDV